MGDHPLIGALRPVAKALGASLVAPGRLREGDIELKWDGDVVGALRMPDLATALPRMIEQIERELGGRLTELLREDKQRAVRMLDERGAFVLRGAIEDVADAMGVSRITIYNYLNAIKGSTG